MQESAPTAAGWVTAARSFAAAASAGQLAGSLVIESLAWPLLDGVLLVVWLALVVSILVSMVGVRLPVRRGGRLLVFLAQQMKFQESQPRMVGVIYRHRNPVEFRPPPLLVGEAPDYFGYRRLPFVEVRLVFGLHAVGIVWRGAIVCGSDSNKPWR